MEKLISLLGSLDKPTGTCSLALSDHMTSKSQLFHTYTPNPSNKKIAVANGSLATVAGFGDIYITPTLILKNVSMNKARGGGLDLLRKGAVFITLNHLRKLGEISIMKDSPCESFEPLDLPHVSTHGDEEPESFESITPESPNFTTEPVSSPVPTSVTCNFSQFPKVYSREKAIAEQKHVQNPTQTVE
ncbi:hypothetical protein CK203_046239 [Vitis vinifera]|uniref:Retrovirus-related Pol polyprotein from transposon TNT 1-94-like beta-barrel domain-containing protein n=1 Tax=Vitis vinifera TaxID=29760 RepID=A0A438HDC8_VITVI|nr:hypothetical protein CK203_046239 [Vitis vinifera]